ncbi:TrmH family RNA methyltransferase [Microbacterium sp.]|uniref:TrmH family RNA methyltransferase n=1 Tax=Microbacterium sp. TaxID=51671 RepID=UPI0039E26220
MELIEITDQEDPRLDDYRGLTDTALRALSEPAGGLYIAESSKVIARAVAAGHRPRSVMVQRRWVDGIRSLLDGCDAPVYLVPDAVAEAVAGYAVHRGALASMHRPALPAVDALIAGARRVAVIEDILDHTNIGALFRSAAALGVDAILVSPRCADPLYRRSVRVSMGTVFQVPWTRLESWPGGLAWLQEAGFVVAATTLGAGAIALDDFVEEGHERIALVFGSEGDGVAAETEQLADRRITIPMAGGVDSLNVAASSAVVFYATRVRG